MMQTIRISLVTALSLSLCLFLEGTLGQRKSQLDEEQKRAFEQQGINFNDVSDDTIFIAPPKFTEEDHGSTFMPKAYQCDGCRGVAHQLKKWFSAAEKKTGKKAKLSYVETLDVIDELCKDEFKNYGLKNVMGKNMLSGEGLEADSMSGMVDTGGIWKQRMQKICQEMLGEFDEEEIYDMYRRNKDVLAEILCVSFCESKGGMKSEL